MNPQMDADKKDSETYLIIGAAMAVHRESAQSADKDGAK